MFDVGGHAGDYARTFSDLLGPRGRVYSFEPHPEIYLDLEDLAVHSHAANIFPFSYAVSDTIGEEVLYAGGNKDDPSTTRASTLCMEGANSDRLGADMRLFKVNTLTLDFFSKKLNVLPDLIKIDVEGAEDRVFGGMLEVLQQSHATVLFEFSFPGSQGSLPRHFETLRSLGYRLCIANFVQFLGNPPFSWENIADSSNGELNEKMFSFVDDDVFNLQYLLCDVLAIKRVSHLRLLASDRLIPITEAVHMAVSLKQRTALPMIS
ncbi:MAG: hypothetical protein NPIRA02_03000 [Nitrospirales bacterium]|nr:MAG: hypothetical protein NPIRA02_03000 [Nitrospirales bacterium]